MKKFLKFIFGVIGSIYLLFAIFVTVCLLCYNEYKVTQFGDKSFIIIDDKSDEYTSGDLVIFTKNPNEEITKGNKIFFYEVTHGKAQVLSGEVTKSEKITDTETTFTIGGSHAISSESVIGKTETARVVPKIGKVLSIFESQYGFLMLIILPALLLFFYAAYSFIKELIGSRKEEVSDTDQTGQTAEVQNSTQQVEGATMPGQPQPAMGNQQVQPAQGMQPAQPTQVQTQTTQPVQAEPQMQPMQTQEPVQSTPVTPSPAPAQEVEQPLPNQNPGNPGNNGVV